MQIFKHFSSEMKKKNSLKFGTKRLCNQPSNVFDTNGKNIDINFKLM